MNTQKKIVFVSAAIAFLSTSCTMEQYAPVQRSEVISAPNQSQKSIYNKSRQWFSEYFVSGKSVVDYEDAQAGTIIGNGFAKIGSDPLGIIQYNINYSIRVDTKDGRLKVTTNVIKHSNTDSQHPTYDVVMVPQSRKDMAERHISSVIENLKAYVASRGSSSNW
jgi:hypothetical protein